MFTSDNFNKYPEAEALLSAMIEERIGLDFFVQCDTQIARQESLVELLSKAGCFSMFVGVESFNRQTLLAAHKGQNRPEVYRDIVRLCREYRISSHFSNIIGFPQDTEHEVDEHLETLQELGPTWASFYILCPIPGTEQYDDFLAKGLISETNLDRFDTTCLTWRHPHFSREQLSALLFRCYRDFYSTGHGIRNFMNLGRQGPRDCRIVGDYGHDAFQQVLRLEANAPHVRRSDAREERPRGRLSHAAQANVRVRTRSVAPKPAIVVGGRRFEPNRQPRNQGKRVAALPYSLESLIRALVVEHEAHAASTIDQATDSSRDAAPERPAVRAKGTVRPSVIPMTMP